MAAPAPGPSKVDFDVVIVGAGISGINAAYRIQSQLPDSTYTILENRAGMGGTWDLFKYPGIRSDSDLYTFGFPWRPWQEQKAIADGESIVNYIRETAQIHGIDKHIQYHHKLVAANWKTDHQAWQLDVEANGQKKVMWARFIFLSTGYYNYSEPLKADIPGLENFKGQIIHPQFWPEDLDYANKKVVIIGSGATAITLLPNLAEKATKVTMLQRSPSYILALPQASRTSTLALKILPTWLVYKYTRIKFLIVPFLFFNFCRTFPNAAKWIMKRRTERQLPKNVPHDPHFKPSYNPWEQRLCVCPDGDFFKCLNDGKADVATGHIETVTDHGITLKSGQKIDADIIITATGLKIQMAGGAALTVDGEPYNIADKYLWKGVMIQDLPNAAFVLGYTNASWTLGADATANYICRLLKHMKANGMTSCTPHLDASTKLQSLPSLNLNSTYIQKAIKQMPKTGDQAPWKARSNYFADSFQAMFGSITNGLQFQRIAT